MPFVRAARLRAAKGQLADLAAAASATRAAEARADAEGFRADVAERDAKRLRNTVADLIARFGELEAAPLPVYLTFHNGRLHSVHAALADVHDSGPGVHGPSVEGGGVGG